MKAQTRGHTLNAIFGCWGVLPTIAPNRAPSIPWTPCIPAYCGWIINSFWSKACAEAPYESPSKHTWVIQNEKQAWMSSELIHQYLERRHKAWRAHLEISSHAMHGSKALSCYKKRTQLVGWPWKYKMEDVNINLSDGRVNSDQPASNLKFQASAGGLDM